MQLSQRMQRLSRMVTKGNRLADVGTDHGYIPIALVRQGRIPLAIAMDINKGPLARAKEHIEACGLDTYITTRLSDGLTELKAGEADTVLIAGMGGMLTIHILEGGAHCLDSVQELILQPQSDIDLVRRYLAKHQFRIVEEDIVLDEGKYYPMMRALHGEMPMPEDEELRYGLASCQRSPDVLLEYLQRESRKARKIMEQIRQNGRAGLERMSELEKQTDCLERMRVKIQELSCQ